MSPKSSVISIFETLRTYRGHLRAFDLHWKRFCHSWLLFNQEVLPSMVTIPLVNFCNSQDAVQDRLSAFKNELIDQLQNWSIKLYPDLKTSSSFSDRPNEQEWIVRFSLDQNLKFKVTRSPLDLGYVNQSRTVKSIYLQSTYSAAIKCSDRGQWNEAVDALNCDEILLCDEQYRPLETNNSNIWSLHFSSTNSDLVMERFLNKQLLPLQGTIWTTPPHTLDDKHLCLAGITRLLLTQSLKELGATVKIQFISSVRSKIDIPSAFFVSSTLKSLSWVSAVDDQEYVSLSFVPHLQNRLEEMLSIC